MPKPKIEHNKNLLIEYINSLRLQGKIFREKNQPPLE